MEKEFSLEKFLTINKISKDDLSPRYYNYLVKIEKAMNIRLKNLQRLTNEMNELEINIDSISQDTGISQKRINNNTLFKELIEWSMDNFQNKIIKNNKANTRAHRMIKDLKEKLKASVTKEVFYINQQLEIENLEYQKEFISKKLQRATMKLDEVERERKILKRNSIPNNVIK